MGTPLSGSPGFLMKETNNEHFLLAAESPGVWEVSFGVLFECGNGGSISPRIRNAVVDSAEGCNYESLQDVNTHRVAKKLLE